MQWLLTAPFRKLTTFMRMRTLLAGPTFSPENDIFRSLGVSHLLNQDQDIENTRYNTDDCQQRCSHLALPARYKVSVLSALNLLMLSARLGQQKNSEMELKKP
jgi:hypothetical protein